VSELKDTTHAPPCTMVIFGGNGDLAKRKLYPALYNLLRDNRLNDDFKVVCFARQPLTHEEFGTGIFNDLLIHQAEHFDEVLARKLIEKLSYCQGDSEDVKTYHELNKHLHDRSAIFYLATPPQLFSIIPRHLAELGFLKENASTWRRLIIEKPFGHDFESAQSLNKELLSVMTECQIFRIDHYLGKETVQNLMVFRFANGFFEPTWNRRYIDSVQISVAETLGIGTRGGYYENAGALRDMMPNHLFQLLAMTAMEPPNSFDGEEVREEKVKLLKSVKPFTDETARDLAVRGQYSAGGSPAYREEEHVDPHSSTETFAALKIEIDNWRWAGVPFYLRTGKRMAKQMTEIVVQFKSVPFQLFRATEVHGICPNQLIIKIQPEEGIALRFASKIPGPDIHIKDVEMTFNYQDFFGQRPSTGYETLLYDCMCGDATLFQRADQIEIGWKIIEPILNLWGREKPTDFPNYACGSWGPPAATKLLPSENCKWRNSP
jgi:glucose-6-phosphate 1-dehydrogenase